MAFEKPIIVIVPGAFHKPIHYTKIIEPIRAQGYEVLPIDLVVTGENVNPNTSHLDDAAEIKRQLVPLLDEGKQAVVVSHSYGSMPVTASVEGQTLAERSEKGLKGGIVAVVNIAGFAFPARGKSIMGDEQVTPPMPYHIVEDGIVHLQESAKPIWFNDVSPDEADTAWANLWKKQSRKSFTTFPQYLESEIQCPKTYILTEDDQAVPPAFQEHMASIGKYDVIKVKSGHAPFITIPDRVVEIILEVAKSTISPGLSK